MTFTGSVYKQAVLLYVLSSRGISLRRFAVNVASVGEKEGILL